MKRSLYLGLLLLFTLSISACSASDSQQNTPGKQPTQQDKQTVQKSKQELRLEQKEKKAALRKQQLAEQEKLMTPQEREESKKLLQLVNTDLYQLSIPNEWQQQKLPASTVFFKKADKVIGAVEMIPYDTDAPITQLLPNHSEVIESKKLTGFFTDVQMYKLKKTRPAAEKNNEVTKHVEFYFIKDKFVYHLSLNSADVSDLTALTIAKTFRLR